MSLTLPGGSKLFTFNGGYTGVIAQWTSQQVTIKRRLWSMYAAGQRTLGLVLQCAPGPIDDGLTLPSDDYSWFANVESLISYARDSGFQFVAPEFVYVLGDDAMRNWKTFDQAGASRIWNLLAHFRDEVMAPCGLPFRIDLGGEWPTEAQGSLAVELAQYVWTNYTGSFWPGGVPCQDATISIPAIPSSIPLLVNAFCGNPPDTIDLHVYDGNGVYPDACSCIVDMQKRLSDAGLALPWDIGETQFNHGPTVASTRDGIVQTRQLVRRIYQWQTQPKPDGTALAIADISPYDQWVACGF